MDVVESRFQGRIQGNLYLYILMHHGEIAKHLKLMNFKNTINMS